MLTVELLKKQTKLATLPDDVLQEIQSMSQIDEETVIGNKVSEIYNRLDQDIEKATSLKKERTEKTYEYAVRAINEVKSNGGDDLKKQIDDLKTEKGDLEKKIKNGDGDAAIRKQLADVEKEISNAKSELKQWKDKYRDDLAAKDRDIEAAQKDAMAVRIDYQFEQALSGLKFKTDDQVPKQVRDAYIKTVKDGILHEFTPDFIDDGKGGKIMVFKKGEEIMRNRDNGLQPFTAADLLTSKLSDIIDQGRKVTGTGTKPAAAGAGHATGTFTLQGAKNQVQAIEEIGNYLTAQGIARGTVEFTEKLAEISTANEVSNLPFQ